MKARVASDESPEQALRRRFERAIFGPPGPLELSGLTVTDPNTMVVFAEAYRVAGLDAVRALGPKAKVKDEQRVRAPYETAMFTCLAIRMALLGHEEFVEHFSRPLRMLPMPPLPKDWYVHRAKVYFAMGIDYTEPQKVVRLFS